MTARPRDPVIAGLGMTEIGRVYGRTAAQFAAEAVRLAAADAGLALGDIGWPAGLAGIHRRRAPGPAARPRPARPEAADPDAGLRLDRRGHGAVRVDGDPGGAGRSPTRNRPRTAARTPPCWPSPSWTRDPGGGARSSTPTRRP